MPEYTPQPISETTFELTEYTPASITETTFELGTAEEPVARVLLLSPENESTGQSKIPTFSWEAFEPSSNRRYQVLVSTSETDFSNALQYITPNTSFTLPSQNELSGNTTYYWKVRPATVVAQESYTESFDVANNPNNWGANWTTSILSGNGGHEILNGKAVSSIQAGDPVGRVGARLNNVVFGDYDIYLRNQSFSDVNADVTYHVRTQGDWRPDHFITGYYYNLLGSQVRIGVMPQGGGAPRIDDGAISFARSNNVDYDIRLLGTGNRHRIYIWESGTTEPTQHTQEAIDDQERFSNGGFASKIAGNLNASMGKESIEMNFSEVDEGDTGTTVTSFSIDQGDTTVSANGTRQLSTTTQGTNVSGGASWQSSNPSVATVDSSGLVTWVSQGTTNITATSTDDGDFTDTIVMTALAEPDTGDYTPQDSQAGDELFLNEFYAATQGQHLGTLNSTSELPTRSQGAFDLDQYIINGELHWFDDHLGNAVWRNAGEIWRDKTGWNNGNVDLSIHDPVGVEKEFINGEWRVTRFDMQKVTFDGLFNGNEIWDGNVCAGTLPPTWGNLTKCGYFNVKTNFMVGAIPDTLQPESDLELLYLGGQRGDISLNENGIGDTYDHRGIQNGKEFEERNKFDGLLPRILPDNIYAVEVRRQYCTGGLPPEWGNKTNLKFIYVNYQKSQEFGGTLPSEWGLNGLNPVVIDIQGSRYSFGRDPYYNGNHQFTGEVPSSWQENWTQLRVIWFRYNPLTGEIPDFVNCFEVRVFGYTDCDFTSPEGEYMFPASVFASGGNALLTYVQMSGNDLNGALRQQIPPITLPENSTHTPRDNYGTVSILDFRGFGITGPIPPWIQEMGGVQQFSIDDNNFDPPFPASLAERNTVRLFRLNNAFTGEPNLLPDVNFGNRFYEFNSSNNGHYGPIPASWASMQTNEDDGPNGCWRYYLSGNDLSGVIPSFFVNMKALEWLFLNGNRFTYCDILPHYNAILANLESNTGISGSRSDSPRFRVDTTKTFPVSQATYSGSGSVTVDLSEIDYANNVYQWQRQDGSSWVNVSGQTTHTLTTSTSGTYRLRITNSDLPYVNSDIRGLEQSISESITVNIT